MYWFRWGFIWRGIFNRHPHVAELFARLKAEIRVLDDMRVLVGELLRLDVARVPSAALFIAEPADGLPSFASWLQLWEHAEPALNTLDRAREIAAVSQGRFTAKANTPKLTPMQEHQNRMAAIDAERWDAVARPA